MYCAKSLTRVKNHSPLSIILVIIASLWQKGKEKVRIGVGKFLAGNMGPAFFSYSLVEKGQV